MTLTFKSTRLAPLAALALCACTSAADYQPDVIDVTDPSVLAADMAFCRGHALAHQTPFSLAAMGSAAASGALNNATAAAVSPPTAPIILGAGAAGSAASEALQQLGLHGPTEIRIFVLCLRERGRKSGAYAVTDPSE